MVANYTGTLASGFLVKHFGGEVAVTFAEQQPAERHALARRAQADLAQHRLHVMPRTARKIGAVGRRSGRLCGREYHETRLALVTKPAPKGRLNTVSPA